MATTRLTPEWSEFLQLLNDRELPYLVVGGIAVIAHGYVRTTKDLVLWFPVDTNVAEKLCDAIHDFFGVRPPVEAFIKPGKIFRMGNYPNAIEIFNRLPGVIFSECFAHAVQTDIDGVTVTLMSLADLRINKAASGRSQDLADLDNLPPA